MQTSGIFTTAQHSVSLKSMGQEVTIAPFSDVHYEAVDHCRGRWNEYLEFAKGIECPVFFGGGDYLDFGSASERKALQKGALHDSSDSSIREMLIGKCHQFIEDIEFMVQGGGDDCPLIGLIGGNHDMDLQFRDDSELGFRTLSVTEYLCECLGVAFLGVNFLGRIQLNCHGCKSSLDVFAHHGRGAGRTKGASLNAVYAMRDIAVADLYFMGHDHGLGTWPGTTIELDSQGKIIERRALFSRMGSFLKAYEPGHPSYIVDANRAPSAIGWVSIGLRLRRDRGKDGRGLWIRKTATVH